MIWKIVTQLSAAKWFAPKNNFVKTVLLKLSSKFLYQFFKATNILNPKSDQDKKLNVSFALVTRSWVGACISCRST